MASTLFNRFFKICKSWPVDESKTIRDFATHLRKQLLIWFPKGELTRVDNLNELDKQIASLERISNDAHKRRYTDSKVSKLMTSSNLTKDQIKKVLSTAYMEENKKLQQVTYRIKNEISETKISKIFLNDKNKDDIKQVKK